jgi:hypothetical protein
MSITVRTSSKTYLCTYLHVYVSVLYVAKRILSCFCDKSASTKTTSITYFVHRATKHVVAGPIKKKSIVFAQQAILKAFVVSSFLCLTRFSKLFRDLLLHTYIYHVCVNSCQASSGFNTYVGTCNISANDEVVQVLCCCPFLLVSMFPSHMYVHIIIVVVVHEMKQCRLYW